MNYKLILHLLGKLLRYEGLLMLPSLVVSFIYREPDWTAFAITIVALVAVGLPLSLIHPHKRPMHVREGFAAVAIIWLVVSLFGALPFMLSGSIPNFFDAFFETASGFTTTGSTILANVEALPHGILFWRSFTHWLGGMGVLVLALALMPALGGGTVNLLKAESPGPTPGKLLPKLGETAKVLYGIYLVMTVVLVALLALAGMPLFDSLIHAFGTAGTGGFSNKALSVGAYNSPAIEWIITIFMLLFGINFSLYFMLLHRQGKRVWKNEELRLYGLIVLGSSALIAWQTWGQYGAAAIRHAFFQVSSIITTSGFATVDFNLWPEFSRCVLLGLMAIGACAGSTGGGLKISRLLLLGKNARRSMGQLIHPRMIRSVTMDEKPVSDQILNSVLVYTVMCVALLACVTLIISLDNFDFTTNFSAALTCLNNVGPGMSALNGPMGNFASYSNFSKLVLTLLMITGRLEIYPMLLLCTRSFWRKTV